MIKNSSGAETIQQHFHDLDISLMNVVVSLSRLGEPTVSTAIQDIKQISQSLLMLEKKVAEQMDLRQS
jgi:hypothetical protein